MELKEQAGALLESAAGYIATRTIKIGLDHGLFEVIAERGPLSSDDLAGAAGIDQLYSQVWCRSAFASGALAGHEDNAYELAPHIEELLLNQASPAYVGGLFKVITEPEMFDVFSENLSSGERIWWDQTSPQWIAAVGETGGAFNTRFIPDGLSQIPGASECLAAGDRGLELACGTGVGLVRLGTESPRLGLVGLDGDAHSLRAARARVDDAGMSERVELLHSGMEDLDASGEYDAITINVSMHECRDIEKVTHRRPVVGSGLLPRPLRPARVRRHRGRGTNTRPRHHLGQEVGGVPPGEIHVASAKRDAMRRAGAFNQAD